MTLNRFLAALAAVLFLSGMYAFWPSSPKPKAVAVPSAQTYTSADCGTPARYAAMRSGVNCASPVLPPERPAVPNPKPVAVPPRDWYRGPGSQDFN